MENNGKGIFYGVIGVATLIVAIIGATFAYFTAADSAENAVAGNTATVGLDLEVTKVSDDAVTGIIPQPYAGLAGANGAIVGTGGKSCVDGNQNSVCQVYKIQVSTTGSSALALNGSLVLTSELTNLKWAVVTDAEGAAPTVAAAKSKGDTAIESFTLTNAAPHIAYIVVYLEEAQAGNVNEAGLGFTGTITYQAGDGTTGVTSTFTGA